MIIGVASRVNPYPVSALGKGSPKVGAHQGQTPDEGDKSGGGKVRSERYWCLPAMTATLSAAEEVLGLEDAWALDLELPAGLFDGDEDDFDEHIGCGLSHVPRSKLGGWPSWQQTPQWLTCAEGRRMTFVAQIDYALGEDSPWANGGYAYLFVCGRECAHREADLVIQTT